ncbi:hypothetical protein ACT4S5_02930 [Kocuria oceani]|uniref:hypothetical protein n=1 Tax=Kocuria oceani TaxID=988827 RepID=UPI0040373F3E
MPVHRTHRTRRLVAASALTLAAATGCTGGEEPEPGGGTPAQQETTGAQETPFPADAAETTGDLAYDGPYDEQFVAELPDHAGQQVRLTGTIGDFVRSRSAYVLTGPAGTDPLLVSARYTAPDVAEGSTVEVTGTLREDFEPPVAEEAAADDESGFYAEHAGEAYLDEATVDPAP